MPGYLKTSRTITIAIIISLIACASVLVLAYYAQRVFHSATGFPDTDIVYQTSDSRHASIGFVNADGTQKQIFPFEEGVVRPVWSPDGKTLYSIDPPSDRVPGGVEYPGYIAIWQEGHTVKWCENPDWFDIESVGTVVSHNGANQALLDRPGRFLLINLDACEIARAIARPGDNTNTFSKYPSLTPDGDRIVYLEITRLDSGEMENAIKIVTIDTGEIVTTVKIGTDAGVAPTLSPDGRWIAYWGSDGIRIVASDGSQNTLLARYPIKNPATGTAYADGTPEPRWSPDSQWVIYHKCIQPKKGCDYAADFSIYKVNVTTGEEVKVVDGGLYPYWRNR